MSVVVRMAVTPADLEACLAIRFEVFVDEQQVSPEEERDALDGSALHFLAEAEGAPLGAARLVLTPDGSGKVGRVAVRRPFRGRGVGVALMDAVTREAVRRGCGRLVLDAQIQVREFYARLGYLAEGDLFTEAGIVHQKMSRSLEPEMRCED